MTAHRPIVAASIRFVVAMMRLYAGIEAQFGKAILDILRKQYPDQEITESDAAVGNKMMAIARKQLQGNDTDSMDAIQKFLMYLTTGSTVADIEYGDDGKPIGKSWDFRKDFGTWQEALRAIYSNLRTQAMSGSMSKSKRKKNERSVDDAFGTRDDGGGAKGDGEGRMPTPDDTMLGKALDDHAAVKEFYGVIDDYLPDLRKTLSEDELALFDLIMEDEVGSFGSDVKENMGQASALKEKYPDMFKKNEKRWSGFVGDLRKKLLTKIWDFVEGHMTPGDYATLKETFFADADPSAVRKLEKDKLKGKDDYQRGIDERKVARYKAKKDAGGLDAKEEADLERLSKKLKDQGVDVEAIKPDADAGAGKKKKKDSPDEKATQSAVMMVAARSLASRPAMRRSDLGL